MMKQVKRNELEKGKKYWIEAEFITDDGADSIPLYFKFGDQSRWFGDNINIAHLEEGKAEESPKYVKNIIKDLKELDEHNRTVWLTRIMDEFGAEIRTKAYSEGFEQGKFEGALEREKVTLTEEQHEFLESFEGNKEKALYFIARVGFGHPFTKGDGDIYDWNNVVYKILTNGLEIEELKTLLIKAVVNGYEVEVPKEPLYWVRDKNGESLLVKFSNDISVSTGYNTDYQRNNKGYYTFTEKEIKDYDERYWAFAVPVEEE